MVMSIVVLAVSTALFFFYLQTICEKALRYEFSRPFFKEITGIIQLDYPQLQDACTTNSSVDYSSASMALKCDFITLEYLLKNADPKRRSLSRREKILIHYFHFVHSTLPILHAFNFGEKQALLKMAAILQFFANSLGEKLTDGALVAAHSGARS